MQKRLLKSYLLIISVTTIISVFISWNRIGMSFKEQTADRTTKEIVLLHDLFIQLEDYEASTIQSFVDEYTEKLVVRITVVDEEGTVIADSGADAETMENHRTREEILRAMETNEIGSSYRYSNTLKSYFQYVAIPVTSSDFSGVIRSATKIDDISSMMNELIFVVIIGIFIGSIISLVFAYFLSKRLVEPIIELTNASQEIIHGNFDEKIYVDQTDEIGQLANTFNKMTKKLRNTLAAFENKNSELESILRSMDQGVVVIDTDLRISIKNKRFLELLYISDENIENRLFYEVTRDLAIFDVLERSKAKNKSVSKETKFTIGSENFVYMVSANPIRSVNTPDTILGTILIVQDITEVRKLENLRTDFVSNVTHELKTPLTSIKGFVETLKTGAIEDKKVAIRFLDIIHIETERLELLINDILTLSEIEVLGTENTLYPEDIASILYETIEILEPKAKKKNIEIITEIEDNIEPFKCNRNRIKQVFINLISNAIKYTEVGYVKIIIRENFKNLTIIIEDSGIGIDEEHIPRLFERFYRVDKGRSRKQGGTGLGLSIVKHIVELYNGRINVVSEMGVGTKMCIYLPYKE